jgi:molecular chaperone GrpE
VTSPSSPSPEAAEPIVEDPDRVVIRDKRRLDPESGQVRVPAADAGQPATDGAAQPSPDGGGADQDQRVAELTADLQRVHAEYANYRKRVERDRVAVVEMATAGLLSGLLPVLDDIDRARQHGDLNGGFAAVGEALEALTAKLGLERFGEVGEPFDPSVHEALMQAEPDPSATVAVCAAVLSPGYRLSGGRVLRPARVSVAEPGATANAAPAAAGS